MLAAGRDHRAHRPGTRVRLDQRPQPGGGDPAGEQRRRPDRPAHRPDHPAFSAGTASVSGIDTVEGRPHRPDRVDHRRPPRARRGGLGRRPLPRHRQRGRLAGRHPRLVRLRQPRPARWSGTPATPSSASPSATGCTTRTGPAKKGTEPEGMASPITTACGTRSSARSGATSSPSTTSADPRAPVLRQILPTTNGPEGCCPSRRADLLVGLQRDRRRLGGRPRPRCRSTGSARGSPASRASSRPTTRPVRQSAGVRSARWPPYRAGRDQLYSVTDARTPRPGILDRRHPDRSPARDHRRAHRDRRGRHAGRVRRRGHLRPAPGRLLARRRGCQGPREQAGPAGRRRRDPADRRAARRGRRRAGQAGPRGGHRRHRPARPGDRLGRRCSGRSPPTRQASSGSAGTTSPPAAWSWFGYQLSSTSVPGDWIGPLRDHAWSATGSRCIERDKLNGPAAAVKRIYTVPLPPVPAADGPLPVLPKTLAVDVLPALRRHATAGPRRSWRA